MLSIGQPAHALYLAPGNGIWNERSTFSNKDERQSSRLNLGIEKPIICRKETIWEGGKLTFLASKTEMKSIIASLSGGR